MVEEGTELVFGLGLGGRDRKSDQDNEEHEQTKDDPNAEVSRNLFTPRFLQVIGTPLNGFHWSHIFNNEDWHHQVGRQVPCHPAK